MEGELNLDNLGISVESKESILQLFEEERISRQKNSVETSLVIAKKLMQIALLYNNPEITLYISKAIVTKRGQLNKVTSYVINECMSQFPKITQVPLLIKFIEGVKNLCEKKIFLEVEHARCTLQLVKLTENSDNDLNAAIKIIENVQVETYGSMTKKEKIEFILHQMRLLYLLRDRTKLYIVAKKINPKFLEEEGLHMQKVSYFLYLFHYHLKEQQFALAGECLERVFEALGKVQNPNEFEEVDPVLRKAFTARLERNNDVETFMILHCLQEITENKRESLIKLKDKYEAYFVQNKPVVDLTEAFISPEISSCNPSVYGLEKLSMFSTHFSNHAELMQAFYKQMIKKNLLIFAKYYKNAKMNRIARLIDAKVELVEECLCELIVGNLVQAKIDRPNKAIKFLSAVSSTSLIDQWVLNINEIVEIVDYACDRIDREEIKLK